MSSRVVAPARPTPAARQQFPLVATLAPVVMSIAIWLVTQSAFALMFAALGPGIAVASVVDSRRGAKRRARAETERFDRELAEARLEVSRFHETERGQLASTAPAAIHLCGGPEHVRWGVEPALLVRLGTATTRSELELEGLSNARGDDAVSTRLRELRAQASQLTLAPVAVELGSGIGIIGPALESTALARGVIVQILAQHAPSALSIAGGENWLEHGPHARDDGGREDVTELRLPDTTVVVATARDAASLPRAVSTVVRIEGTRATVVRGAVAVELLSDHIAAELISAELAAAWAGAAAEAAARAGLAPGRAVPTRVRFRELAPPRAVGLAAAIGESAEGAVVVDLVSDGPHAVIGGTTGSGKSELLITWLLSMAAVHSPAEVNFLLFDFKGGSSFAGVAVLPHCVGLVTDLDGTAADRAVASLSAELRHRERLLASSGARYIDEVSSLARLVIVVDEFAAMAAELPGLHAQFADIASRGRSLGVHLVLCTQRPAGVVHDAVLANASLRISLRVNNRVDSTALLGSAEAASPLTLQPGRAVLARPAHDCALLQIAIADPDDVATVAAQWQGEWDTRRPWLDPLPTSIDFDATGSLGLIDLPKEQRRAPLEWRPSDGHLLVLGGARSGRSNLVDLFVAAHGAAAAGPDLESVWDAVATSRATLIAIDDVDVVLGRMPSEYQQAFAELLAARLRSGESRFVLTAQRLGSGLQSLASLCDSRLVLRMPSKQDHVLSGADADTFRAECPPGSGVWKGSRVQLARAPRREPGTLALAPQLGADARAVVVSPRAIALTTRLVASGRQCSTDPRAAEGLVITDPDGWQAQWQAFTAIAKQLSVVFIDCSLAEFRQLSRQRVLPPLVDNPDTGWMVLPTGECSRVRLF